MKKLIYFFLLAPLFLISCSDDDVLVPVREALVDYENILNLGQNTAKSSFSAIDLEEAHPDVQYDLKVYKITYTVSYKEQELEASALVAVPNTTDPVPVISFQHGTIIAHSDAPSESGNVYFPLYSLASTGYIVVVPDYIGFGASEGTFHPYYVAEAMGESVYRAILAANELVLELDYGVADGKLFLSGYSEGGFATMAAHKFIEENADMTVTASAPSSGGYDIKGMQEWFFGLETYHQPFYMAYVALAYNDYYGWGINPDFLFQEPYASALPALFDGTKSGSYINNELTEIVADFIQPDALENFDTSESYSQIKNALIENGLTSWSPEAPVYMYHGTSDITVPYENSVTTYEKLLELPGNSEKIGFYPIQGATHGTGFLPYIKDVYFKFKSLK